jgi:hypothetical protein
VADPEIVVRGRGDFRDLNRDVAAAEARFSKMGQTIKRGLATSALAGTAALVKLGVDSVRAGSAAEQSIGATETVFGKYADTVIRRSKEAADSVGLSANQYRELANVTGATLANAGTPLKQVTKLTAELTRRAADMAATYGGTTKEAIESVSSLLRGEADPIERYGVSIKQSDVNARLAAQGLDKLTGAALKQAEQQARLDLLMQQTSKTAGQFGRESDTIAGKGQRLGAKVEDLEAKFSDLLIPALSAAADWASEELVPALDDLHGWLSDNSDEFASLASSVKDTVVPALQGAVDVVGEAVELFSDLPAPVKEFGIQAALAAAVLPKVTAATTVMTKAVGKYTTAADAAAARSAAMGSAMRTAAGVGGMVALTQGATASNEAISLLSSTAGGALLGFSVGGPWGAAIGAGAGGLLGLAQATSDADKAARESTTTWSTYASTLDNVTGATTRATEAMALEELRAAGLLKAATDLGINRTTLVQGVLGEADARAKVAEAIKAEVAALREKGFGEVVDAQGKVKRLTDEEIIARNKNLSAITAEIGEIQKATQAKREDILITAQIPDKVITEILTPGLVDSKREVRALARSYALTPDQVKTVLEVTGVASAVKDVDRFSAAVGVEAPKKAKEGGKKTGKAVTDGATEGLIPGLKAFKQQLTSGTKGAADKAVGPARTGGGQVGSNLGAGMYTGMDLWLGPIYAKGYQMGKAGVDGAKAGAATRSPSRETIWVGRMLGEGMTVGMDATAPAVGVAGRRLGKKAVREILAGVTGGLDGVEATLDRITKLVEKSIKGKNQDKREKAVLKSLKDQYAALRANGRAQDAINQQLEDARGLLEQATSAYNDYANAARDAVTATGNITQLGRQDDGTVSLTSLLNELEKAANDADRFVDLSEKLAGMGLSKESIDQILAAGPSAALATVEAIETGGQEAVNRINDLQGRLAAAGTRLGQDMAGRYYQAGVDAAQGLINGLSSQLAALQAVAQQLGDALIISTKKKLKSKSPSKVFEGIGQDVVAGLSLGIDDTVASRSGASLAASLVKGFDNPQLAADVLSSSSSAATIAVRLSAAQVSQLQRGREIQMDLDYARSNGVLGTTF